MQGLRSVIESGEFQIYVVSMYGNILFAYSPVLPLLPEQSLRILPLSTTFSNLKKFCFQTISIQDLYVNST